MRSNSFLSTSICLVVILGFGVTGFAQDQPVAEYAQAVAPQDLQSVALASVKCCDPGLEPGVGGNPFCFEGASCCAYGVWRCNNANGSPSCQTGVVCDDDGAVGKCCLEIGGCVDLSAAECANSCGFFFGAGTTCTNDPIQCPLIPIAVSACCLPDGSCTITTFCECDRAGGTVSGTVDCEFSNCQSPEPPEICGGIQGIQCSDPNDFCKTAPGECCCDFQGVCTSSPQVCTALFDPVCGCDGVTYSNECFADQAGVSVDFAGLCEPPPSCGERGAPCDSNDDCCSDRCKRNGRCR